MANSRVDYTYKDASKLFFTSDTHWGHEHIIKFCNRPFNNIDEMDEALVRLWNETVPEDGLVFHLGDFCWAKKWDIRKKLNGKIVLVQGNHDFKNRPQSINAYEEMFEGVFQQLFLKIEGKRVYLNHYPFLCYGGTYRNTDALVWQLHGHTHFGPNTSGRDNDRLKLCFPTQYDVGVDNNNYRPISWKEVTEIINKQIADNQNYCNKNNQEIEQLCQKF